MMLDISDDTLVQVKAGDRDSVLVTGRLEDVETFLELPPAESEWLRAELAQNADCRLTDAGEQSYLVEVM